MWPLARFRTAFSYRRGRETVHPNECEIDLPQICPTTSLVATFAITTPLPSHRPSYPTFDQSSSSLSPRLLNGCSAIKMLIKGEKFACDACVRGHRVSSCTHTGSHVFPSSCDKRKAGLTAGDINRSPLDPHQQERTSRFSVPPLSWPSQGQSPTRQV